MTEAEWLGCNDPQPMLLYLRGRRCGRKRRLFAVACCRRIGAFGHMSKGPCRSAVEVAARYADGLATENEREAALGSLWVPDEYDAWDGCQDAACCVADEASRYEPPPTSSGLAHWLATGDPGGSEEADLWAELERDAAACVAGSVACVARAYVSCEPALGACARGRAGAEQRRGVRASAGRLSARRHTAGRHPTPGPAFPWGKNTGCVPPCQRVSGGHAPPLPFGKAGPGTGTTSRSQARGSQVFARVLEDPPVPYCNLRTGLERIIERAGLVPWPKLFRNLRTSRQTN